MDSVATFCAKGQPKLTILVDEYDIITISKQCLCAMFGFQPSYLHMSKDVAYDVNNKVSNLMYQMPTIIAQGKQWVVNFGWYRLINNNVLTHLQDTILMLRTITSMVKIKIVDGYRKQETKGIDTHLQLLDILSMFVFIDLFNS